MDQPVELAIARWRDAGLKLLPGLPAERIVDGFRSVGRKPSSDVIALYSVCGGFEIPDTDDAHFFSLWSFEKALAEASIAPKPYFPFADGLIASHTYSFLFRSPQQSAVTIDYDASVVAESVPTFFAALAEDPKSLWLP